MLIASDQPPGHLDTSSLERVPAMHGLLEMEELANNLQSDQVELASEWTRLLVHYMIHNRVDVTIILLLKTYNTLA